MLGPAPHLMAIVHSQCLAWGSNIADNDAQNPAVDEEEQEARQPQSGQEGAPPHKLKLEALLEPQGLGGDPEDQRRDAERLVAQKRGPREVQREEGHVPEEVLRKEKSLAKHQFAAIRATHSSGRGILRDTYLAGADLVEGHKGKRLREHRGGQVLLRQHQGHQHAREEQLGEKRQRLDAQGRGLGERGRDVELDVVGAEVMPVVDPGDVVEVGVDQERRAIPEIEG